MKRAITALTLVCALMLSVVACQVYNPTNNETLYTAMRTEGAISWADYSKKFEDADGDQKYEILMEYEAFRKLYNDDKVKWVDSYNSLTPAYQAAKEVLKNAEKAVVDAGNTASQGQKDAVTAAKAALEEATAPLSNIYGTVEALKVLWDKEFDVLWDWNGKM